ncbi:thioesterase II family protein [Phytohabitans rumicis]|uniref:Thioesterase n=1 Tax=Phytohabitans rumicis TaxID=1076125 RepID=A0A6V8LAQ2_9ACTN|nr:alpha/beta fold hydrolase [Phytohabitans rumicis]GFJ91619.1 thioesterase [Phytohabitans rumicis]
MGNDLWTAAYRQSSLELFCLPHAGGAAAHFAGWARWLPEGVTVVPVDLPGHGRRRREPLITDLPALVAEVTGTIADATPADSGRADQVVLFGHSFGAVLAYEVARELHRAGRPPRLLLTAARNGPSAAQSHRPIHALPDAQLVVALHRLGGTPESVVRDPRLMRQFLPALRADLRIAELYARAPGDPLPCPVAAYVGRHDRMADGAGALAWERETAGRFDLTVLDAGHFLLEDPGFVAAVTGRLRAALAQDLQRTGQNSGSA